MTWDEWRAGRAQPAPRRPRRSRQGPPQASPVVVDGVELGLHDRHLFRVVLGGGGDGVPTPDRLSALLALTHGKR